MNGSSLCGVCARYASHSPERSQSQASSRRDFRSKKSVADGLPSPVITANVRLALLARLLGTAEPAAESTKSAGRHGVTRLQRNKIYLWIRDS